ncbi:MULTISPECIES: alpha/beta fold hydrolase [unclassified Saccharopolyspora]|uniref:alpha/beta fold hydrolase n=1 Tax=unclassified Saccharopolyspora TaxID=2646250 RepID=UPI001CD63D0C|nr:MULTISPECIES: alpha/beta hydrolase [unclassified Saccharopolyspora]MCA1189162.1 alpha/beta hydrolase [Saccharopolyspora sp. 6T]MCA1229901.1 alpha/beta hydrolase [Saccharopolyspora sp. 6M]MCA1282870.1 alpha/beta hydrolase [Saccharopolyspora sp. 7B]
MSSRTPALGTAAHEQELRPESQVARIQGSDLHFWTYRSSAPDEAPETSEPPETSADEEADRLIVMVHGLRGTHHGLEPIVARLGGGRTVVVPDLPGFGDSGPMTGRAHDVPGYADAIIELIEHLGGRDRPVVLLGHSFGSMVAAHVVSRGPELVERLVLVNPISTPALRGPRVVLSWLTSLYYALGTALPSRLGRALLANRLVVWGTGLAMLRTRDPEVRRFVHDSHQRHFSRFHSPALLTETYEASVTGTVADHSASLTLPTLLIAGESDDIAPLAGQRELLAGLPDAELVVIPGVGHLVHYETPAAAAHAIDRFLGES